MKTIIFTAALSVLALATSASQATETHNFPASTACAAKFNFGQPSPYQPAYPNRVKLTRGEGSLYVRAQAAIDCDVPYINGRYVSKISLDVSYWLTVGWDCRLWTRRTGTSDYHGAAARAESSGITEFSFTDLGVLADGSAFNMACNNSSVSDSSVDAYTRYWGVTVEYADQ